MARSAGGSGTSKRRGSLAPQRIDGIVGELDQWRAHALPDPAAPLGADDVARLVRDCCASLAIDPVVAESFSVNTVHYYRRKNILDEPDGRTSSARYGLRHVWQAAGARLAGHLGLVTLAEARDIILGADETTLRHFVAARIADARGRQASRSAKQMEARPLRASHASRASHAFRDSQTDRANPSQSRATATVIALGGDALCLIPSTHAALSSLAGARTLVAHLATALGLDPKP